MKPYKKLTLLTAWHWFDKASRGDFIYNIAGAPLGGPTSSRDRSSCRCTTQLTDAVFDPYSKQPSYKACAVRVWDSFNG